MSNKRWYSKSSDLLEQSCKHGITLGITAVMVGFGHSDTSSNFGWFIEFYDMSTFVGYLTSNPFLCKSVLFKTIQFSISTQFNGQKHFYFKLFKQWYVTIQLSVNTVLMSKNSSLSNNSVKHKPEV